uniref:Uncharacterized protein n=1 Tax=Anguilla anguilla TaxID=7936 RepID=A0A0E9WAW5_ANGAN
MAHITWQSGSVVKLVGNWFCNQKVTSSIPAQCTTVELEYIFSCINGCNFFFKCNVKCSVCCSG